MGPFANQSQFATASMPGELFWGWFWGVQAGSSPNMPASLANCLQRPKTIVFAAAKHFL